MLVVPRRLLHAPSPEEVLSEPVGVCVSVVPGGTRVPASDVGRVKRSVPTDTFRNSMDTHPTGIVLISWVLLNFISS